MAPDIPEPGFGFADIHPEGNKPAVPCQLCRPCDIVFIGRTFNQMIACNNKHQLRQRELQTGKHDGRRSFSPDLLQHEPVGNTLEGLHLVFHDKLIFFISNYDKLIAIGNIPGNRLLKNGMILLDADKLLRIIFPGQRPKPVASSSGQYKTFHMHLAPVSSL